MKVLGKTTILGGAAALAFAAGTAGARDYSYSTFLAPNEPLAEFGYVPWAEAIKERTNGEVSIDVYLGGSLLPPREALSGTRDGIADSAMHAATYTPSELPLWNIIPGIAFKYPDPLVATMALTEYGLFDPEGQNEFLDKGVLFLGGYSTPEYYLICTSADVASLDKLSGKQVRTPGSTWSAFANSIDMIDVNIPSTEMYTAFERGAVDCAAADLTMLNRGAKLMRVAKGVNLIKMGPYAAGISWVFNPASWQSISEENRKIILEENAKSAGRSVAAYEREVQSAIDEGESVGIEFVEPAEDLTEAYQAFRDGLDASLIAAGQEAGIETIEEEVAQVNALFEKWAGKLEGVDRTDIDALTSLFWDELYSKIDVATFGMN